MKFAPPHDNEEVIDDAGEEVQAEEESGGLRGRRWRGGDKWAGEPKMEAAAPRPATTPPTSAGDWTGPVVKPLTMGCIMLPDTSHNNNNHPSVRLCLYTTVYHVGFIIYTSQKNSITYYQQH